MAIKITNCRAVFFDAVGTLIHPAPPAAVAYAAAARRRGSARSVEEVARRFRDAFLREEAADLAQGLQTSEEREARRWRRIVADVLDDVDDTEGCFAELFAHFARPENWRCGPDVGPVLAELARRGYALGIASNFDGRLHRVAAGLAELRPVSHLVISSEVGWRKPDPAFFAAVTQAACLPPQEVLFVGDDRVNDYEGARAAGLQALLLDPAAPPGLGAVLDYLTS